MSEILLISRQLQTRRQHEAILLEFGKFNVDITSAYVISS
jgi:hypothetical protein